MQTSMVLSALIMGLVGGPHCVAMCGAACAGIARVAAPRSGVALFQFQVSRLIGYAAMGAVAAGTVQGLAWFGANTAVLRPVWTMMHVAALLLGLALVWQARQPAWVEGWAQKVWRKAKPAITAMGSKAPFVLGAGWALMPCGLLYSALLVASLSASVLDGAVIMTAFALGTSVVLTAGPWLLLRVRGGASGAWGIRLAGMALVGTSGWALWMGITQPSGIWCL
ncbi:MAG TPA: sulfite exporter TauE/SafE family protein [Burkholderiaceae bacterium]|nr:sulfite exporter TauE/SafE family protein [Burkholderiaceae bacterium]